MTRSARKNFFRMMDFWLLLDTLQSILTTRISNMSKIKDLKNQIKMARERIEAEKKFIQDMREAIRSEQITLKAAREQAKFLRENSQKAFRQRQQRPSKGVVYTPEQIAEMNAERGIV